MKKRDAKESAKLRRAKVHWSPTEDLKLKEGLQLFGKRVNKLAEFIGSRDVQQVRYRINYTCTTKPKSRRRAERMAHIRWSKLEENKFAEGVKLFGANW